MTKYLIIALVGLILITSLVLFFNSSETQPPQPIPSSKPSVTSRPSIPSPISDPSISPLPAPTSSADLIKYQSETDKLYADQVKQQEEQYPWLEQMPLQSSSYFVYFETSNNTFTAEIYNQSQYEQLKQEVFNRLQALNIDTSKYNINWQIKPR